MRQCIVRLGRGIKRRYPATKTIFGEERKTSLAPPRSTPHGLNVHFTDYDNPEWRAGDEYEQDASITGYNSPYQRRYKEPLRVGRQKFDGSYTSHLGNVPIYSRKSIPENLKAHQRITSDDGSILKSDKDDIAWFRENWDELDLIDPQKFAIFPGDVVLITNKSHKDYRKFGVVSNIYMPHGYVWVSGLNITRPVKISTPSGLEDYGQGFVSNDATEFKSEQLPFNYRDVKLLKYGQYLIDLSANRDISELDHEKLWSLLRDAGRNRSKVFLDFIESNGLLETINPRMIYKNFDYENFSAMSWTDLGASRICIKTKSPIRLPIKQRPGGQMGESEVLSAYNEIGSSDFAQVIKYSWLWDREERDQWESLEDIEDNPDDRIREQSESNPKTWQEKIRGDKYEEDKHIFQYKPLP